MRKSEAIRIARQIEGTLKRGWILADRLTAAAEEGCPVAKAALAAIEDEGLPAPITDVPLVVRRALEKIP